MSRIETAIEKMLITKADHIFIEELGIQEHNSWSGSDLFSRAHFIKNTLIENKILSGDRVVLCTDSSAHSITIILGVLLARATVVLLDPHLPKNELSSIIIKCEARALFFDGKKPPIQPSSLDLLYINQNGTLYKHTDKNTSSKKKIIKGDQNIAFVLYTSGTTESARGVMLSHSEVLSAIDLIIKNICIADDEKNLCLLPLYHVFGLVQNVLIGLCTGICTGIVKTLSPDAMLAMLSKFCPTLISAVPLQLRHMQNLLSKIPQNNETHKQITKITGGQLKKIATGGSQLDPIIRKSFEALNLTIIEGYGLTESTGAVSLIKHENGVSEFLKTGVKYKINNPNADGCGEICISGPMVFKGYFADQQATAKVLKGKWLHTGDLGLLHDDGHLELRGRIKEIMVTEGGKNVMPDDVEKLYQNIPGIAQIAVFPLNTPRGDRIHAAIVADKNTKLTLDHESIEALIQQHGSTLQGHMRIEKSHLTNEIPRSKIGKVKRHLLQKQFNTKSKEPLQTKADNNNTSSDLTEMIVQMVNEFSDVKEINPNRSFVENGIDSLSALSLATKLEKITGKKISPTIFWAHPTPYRLANHLKQKEDNPYAKSPIKSDEDIAVIGLSCRFSGASNPSEFWKLLNKGINPVASISAKRKDLLNNESDFIAAFLEDIEQFDPLFFNISPSEANNMDPQHRLWLELCWEAMAQAGIKPESLRGSETAVFTGCGPAGYSNQLRNNELHASAPIGNSSSAMSGRISYLLDLCGPSETIDTACSSSLVAIHRACTSLQSGESTLAFAGGTNLLLDMDNWACLEKAGMLAADGISKVFDEKANGYVRGEGGGTVILQRLSDAVKDGHRVLGVIRASGVNQDGASNGFTAPSGASQEQLLRKVLNKAHLKTHDIDYIECHGTGTRLGDPIEVNTIQTVYGQNREKNPLILGAVKSQIGHLEAAAGIAGFIKTILVLAHRKVTGNLNFSKANPHFDLQGLSLAAKHMDLSNNHNQPARAAVSSFGFTGSNCHIILESREANKECIKNLLPAPNFNKQKCWFNNSSHSKISIHADTKKVVSTIIENCLQLEPGSITHHESLFEYGIDSINIVDIAISLEKQFNKKLKVEQLYDGIENINDIVDWIEHTETTTPSITTQTKEPKERGTVLPIIVPGIESKLNSKQQQFFNHFSIEYAKRTSKSKKQSSQARATLADQRSVSGYQPWKKEIVYPIHAESANGSHIADIDGYEYIDIAMEFGANLFGHNAPFIKKAVQAYLENPLPLAVQNTMATDVAQRICRLTGSERVSLLCTGSEAVMASLRIARIATKRNRVAMFRWSYHGSHDQVLSHPGSDGSQVLIPGIHPNAIKDVLLLDYDNPESLEILKKEGDSLAAILVEPVQSRHPDLQPIEFLKSLRKISKQSNSLLIFDEVITGFRCHAGGASVYFNCEPDLSIYGKIIGGGYPLSAVAGKACFMNHVDGGAWQYGDTSSPSVEQTFVGGTYNGHPLSLAAATAVLQKIEDDGPELHQQLNLKTETLTRNLNSYFNLNNIPIKIEQFSSLFRFVCSGNDTDLFYACLRHHGVYATEVRNCFLSTAHTKNDLLAIEHAVINASTMLSNGGFLCPLKTKANKPLNQSSKSNSTSPERHIVKLGGSNHPSFRLFCLPYAGGGSHTFRSWPKFLPEDIELCYLQLPGREKLVEETLEEDFDTLLNSLCSAMEGYTDLPFAIYGHSMGATLAFEIARRYNTNNNLNALIVSGENAPSETLPSIDPKSLNDKELLLQIKTLGVDIPKNYETHFLPRLKADLSICASYHYRESPVLDCPLMVIGANKDPLVPFSKLEKWSNLTQGPFSSHQMQGGHFFNESDAQSLLTLIRQELEKHLYTTA